MIKTIFLFAFGSFILMFFCSCRKETTATASLIDLPADTGGVHTPFHLGATNSYYGYYLYLPSAYKGGEHQYPLLVFLHGSGEKGNSESNPAILDRVLKNGPPKLIQKNQWSPQYPMIVVSPQCHEGGWNAGKIYDFIQYISHIYRVNESRIYLTGLSMGGFGTFNYLQTYGDSAGIAAAVPICGGGNPGKAGNLTYTPLWIFHGDADNTVNVNQSIRMYDAIVAEEPPVLPRLTIYNGVGHNSWTRTYDESGIGTGNEKYDSYNISVYDWLLQYTRK